MCALTKMPEPLRAQINPRANRFDRVCCKKQKATSGTHRLDRVARKVALPRLVLTRDKCQKTRSPAKQAPAISRSRHCGRLGRLVSLFSLFAPSAAMTSSTGSARATRQKPAAVLPTSISRNAAVVAPKISAPSTTASTDKDVVLGDVIGCRCAWGGGLSGVASVGQTLQYGGFLTHKFRSPKPLAIGATTLEPVVQAN